ncbi:unnamed protein product [Closterium sp. NIES-54]
MGSRATGAMVSRATGAACFSATTTLHPPQTIPPPFHTPPAAPQLHASSVWGRAVSPLAGPSRGQGPSTSANPFPELPFSRQRDSVRAHRTAAEDVDPLGQKGDSSHPFPPLLGALGESGERKQFVTREEFHALRSELYAMFAQLGLRRGAPASYAGGSAVVPMKEGLEAMKLLWLHNDNSTMGVFNHQLSSTRSTINSTPRPAAYTGMGLADYSHLVESLTTELRPTIWFDDDHLLVEYRDVLVRPLLKLLNENAGGGSGGSRGGASQRGGSVGGQRQQQQRRSETPTPQQLREWFAQRGASGGSVRFPYVIRTGDSAGQTCGKFHTQHRFSSRLYDAWRAEFGDEAERPRWLEFLRSGVEIFALDYDAILAAMYALTFSAEGDFYLCVPPDPGIEAAALCASESALPGTVPAEALHTFMLDLGTSRCFFHDIRGSAPGSSESLLRLSPVGPLLLPLRVSRRASYSCSPRIRPRSGALFVSRLVAIDSPLAPPPWSPLPATPPWHALLPPCFWSSQVSASPPALALPRPAFLASRGSSAPLLTPPVSPDDCSPADSPHGLRLQLRERFREDLLVLRPHSDIGGEFSSDLFWEFCHGEGILQSFTLPASLQQNGVAECRIGFVMEVARTSMIYAAAPHFLWSFAVKGSRAFVRDTSADKLSSHTIPCDPAPSGVSHTDPLPLAEPIEVTVDSGAARGTASGGAEPASAEPKGAEPERQ